MISAETEAKLRLWHQRLGPQPKWYVWTGGWYECHGEENYYTSWPMLGTDSVVFDVGGYEGEWTSRMVRLYGCMVYLFEPSIRAYHIALDRLKMHKSVILCPFGLGATDGMFQLGDSDRDGASFLSSLSPTVQATKTDIVRVFRAFHIDHVDLMSINIEGDEFELLSHIIESGLATRIHRFMIQWHSIVPNADYRQLLIQERLACTHKMLWNLGAWEAWEMVNK